MTEVPQVVKTLAGKRVVFTGTVSRGNRKEAIRLANGARAIAKDNTRAKVSRFTDILVRGYGKSPDDDEDEREVLRLQRAGHHILMIDDAGFCSLLDGGWAYAVRPYGSGVVLPPQTAPYRPATADTIREPVPTTVDLAEATNAHNQFQNDLADMVVAAGFLSVRSTLEKAQFDLGWHDGETLNIVEVKSLQGTHPVNQLRLGLGQVLDYATRFRRKGRAVRPLLAVDALPPDPEHWDPLCREYGVTLIWPDVLERMFESRSV